MTTTTAAEVTAAASSAVSGMDLANIIIQIVTAVIAIAAFLISLHNWRKANEKRKLLTDPNEAFEVVPAWFTKRMMTDHWYFALLLSNGRWVLISQIESISSDGKWIEVLLSDKGSSTLYKVIPEDQICSSLTEDRPKATIRAADVVLATEAADT
jgi:hypothetical protein